MTAIPIFNFDACLPDGTCLIEASAGTGKTYTIAGLYLKLLLEKQLPADQILVVTFTEAATEELKDRIRRQLKNAGQAFSEKRSKDQLLASLLRSCRDRDGAKRSLEYALNNFDESAIFTIHGFCNRMLNEHAFESGNRFDTELAADSDTLKKEIAEDFWRLNLYSETLLFIRYCREKNVAVDPMADMIKKNLIHPRLTVIPSDPPPDTTDAENCFRSSFADLRSAWQTCKGDVASLIGNHHCLNGVTYRKDSVPVWIRQMDAYLKPESPEQFAFEHFIKFTSEHIRQNIKRGFSTPVHAFFQLCQIHLRALETLRSAYNKRVIGLKSRLIDYYRKEIHVRRKTQNTQSFDDLLVNLRNALTGPGGDLLAENIRKKFKAALIDEFQDTDPIQYDIFRKIFDAEGSILYYIGDPKQAIYGFRGADIFAYMEASGSVRRRYTLNRNWRSESGLVSSINSIFQNSDHPFIFEDILFHKIDAAETASFDLLTEGGKPCPQFQFLILESRTSSNGSKPVSAGTARQIIARAAASEIASVLNRSRKDRFFLGKKPLSPGDIAVLVRSHREADLMYNTLNSCQIPAVLFNTGNLFETPEALETERVLAAIAEPDNIRYVRTALTTDIFGASGEAADAAADNDALTEDRTLKLKYYAAVWQRLGFIRMFKEFLYRENVLPKLMAFPDGERRNTNLLHLMETLHGVSVEKKLQGMRLVHWLSEQRNSNEPIGEQYLLRLESDAAAVKIVTIHKSKGLEYPVVFCPFTWAGLNNPKDEPFIMFHNPDNPKELIMDIGSDDESKHRDIYHTETLAEKLRLLYVALTRAKNRCYMLWGRINKADTSAPAFLLHFPQIRSNFAETLSRNFKNITDDQMKADIESICRRSADGFQISVISDTPAPLPVYVPPADQSAPDLTSRIFSSQIDKSFRISSFSSLVSGAPFGEELADRDSEAVSGINPPVRVPPAATAENRADQEKDIFSFPKGAAAGSFLHDIFEHIDFSETGSSDTDQVIADKLAEYHYDSDWQPAVRQMIRHVLSLKLGTPGKPFSLSDIPPSDRLTELEFYYPLRTMTVHSLKEIFGSYWTTEEFQRLPEQIGRLNFSPVRGFMKGFIDLVFRYDGRYYLVDWKSNHLGNSYDCYRKDLLHPEMIRHYYTLQYCLYLAALNRYLTLRHPGYRHDAHFGEVYYIFLRGVHPDYGPEYGLYRDRPTEEMIAALSRRLIDCEA